MKLLTPFASLYAKERLEEINDSSNAPFDAQHEQLFELLSDAEETSWGHRYDFASIHSYQEFRERLPLQRYSELQTYVQRMLAGESNLLWSGSCPYFIPANDTTNKGHLLPMTRDMLQENFYSGISDSMIIYLNERKAHTRLFDHYSLWIGARQEDVVYRNLSRILLKESPFSIRIFSRPIELPHSGDDTEEYACLLSEAKRFDIGNIQGRPSRLHEFLHFAEAATGKKGLKSIFPELEVFFHRGIPSQDQLEHSPVTDIDYHASYCTPEGYIGLQLHLDEPAFLLRLDAGIFYEFLPEDAPFDVRQVIPLEEVSLGKPYRLILTTRSGLWRYCSEGPLLRFVSEKPYKFVLI